MEFDQDDRNIFKLSPLSWEEISNEIKESNTQSMNASSGSPILSQRRPSVSLTNSITSNESFSLRKNAGNTPKKSLKVKSSIEVLWNKLKYQPHIKFKENTSSNARENSISLDEERNELIPFSEEKKPQYSSIPELTGSDKSSPIPISQFDLKPTFNSSFITIEETYDSDADMFEDFELPTKKSAALGLLANHSCQYYEEKLSFPPRSTFNPTKYLQKELFETSRQEIKEKIDKILTLLED